MTRNIRHTITLAALLLALPWCAGRASAQVLPGPAWYVVASGGGSASIPYKGSFWDTRYDSVMVSYTIGETCIAFDHQEKFDVTEGFQQPDGYGIRPYDPFGLIGDLTFFPNPCRQFGFVRFNLNESFSYIDIKVFAVNGRCGYQDHFLCGDGPITYQLPTGNLAPGMYIVEVVGENKKRYIGKLVVIP